MGLYNFKKRFVPKILDESKTHTIRAPRRYPDTPGKTMHLFTGLRTKAARCLMRTPCVAVQQISIDLSRIHSPIFIDGKPLSGEQCETFARRDGFESFADMVVWWDKTHPGPVFIGNIFHWKEPRKL